jgi:hypothetical protein
MNFKITRLSTITLDAPEPRTEGLHLPDIEIAKILGLAKATCFGKNHVSCEVRCHIHTMHSRNLPL